MTPDSPTDAPKPKRPGVRLSADEAWAFIESSHTGIVTTLRRDGVPIALPVWFAVLDRCIYMSTPAGSKKVARVRNDSRASFLVEGGEMWAELTAVHLTGTAEIIEPSDELATRFAAAINVKYDAFRAKAAAVPDATKKHYAQSSAFVRFTPDERIVSWDNARLFAKSN